MVALVADHLLEAIAVWADCLDPFGRVNKRLPARHRVPFVGILHRHTDDRAGLEIDGMLGPVRQMRPFVYHFGDLRVGTGWMRPVIV